MFEPVNERWAEFIRWKLAPDSKKGSITSEAAWARAHKINERTVRRWKTLPEFQALYKAIESGVVEPSPHTTTVTDDTPQAGDEADYRVVKTALVEGAKGGNPKYLELYFRTYGKPFVDEEVAARSTDLAGMDLDDLVSRSVAAVDWDTLVRVLGSMGWSVVRSSGDGTTRLP